MEEKKWCHESDIEDHTVWCLDSSECRFGQPSGPDDYINECECEYEEDK